MTTRSLDIHPAAPEVQDRAMAYAVQYPTLCWLTLWRENDNSVRCGLKLPWIMPSSFYVALGAWFETGQGNMPPIISSPADADTLVGWQGCMRYTAVLSAPRMLWRLDEPTAALRAEMGNGTPTHTVIQLKPMGMEEFDALDEEESRWKRAASSASGNFEDRCRHAITERLWRDEMVEGDAVWRELVGLRAHVDQAITEERYVQLGEQYLIFIRVWRELGTRFGRPTEDTASS